MGRLSSAVTAEQRQALTALRAALPDGAYLAGGVAIAAALHHRISHDLDFFVPRDFEPERMSERLSAEVPGLTITSAAPGTLYFELHTVPSSLITERYPLLVQPSLHPELAVHVASLEDLICMKLSAIAARGLARDFWDLHALLAHGIAGGSLAQALNLYRTKFASDDVGHVIRALAYFGDADAAPLPRGLSASDWERIKRDVERHVTALG